MSKTFIIKDFFTDKVIAITDYGMAKFVDKELGECEQFTDIKDAKNVIKRAGLKDIEIITLYHG